MRTAHMLPYGGGVSLTETPSGQRSPWTVTPWTENPLDRDPPLWTESETGVKILPSRNFVASGKMYMSFY